MSEEIGMQKWYEKTWVIVLFLIFFWPVGLFLMWKYANWQKTAKTIVTVVISLYILFCIAMVIILGFIGFAAFSEQTSIQSEPTSIEEEYQDEEELNGLDEIAGEESEWDLTEDGENTDEFAAEDNVDSAKRFSRLEDLSLQFDDRDWQLGHEAEESGAMIREYVVDGESVEEWTELVTAQFFPDLQGVKSAEFLAQMEQQLKDSAAGDLEWNVFNEKDDSAMYEFILTNDEYYGDQHEVARVIEAEDGMYVLHYAIMEAPMSDENHKTWVDLLEKASDNK